MRKNNRKSLLAGAVLASVLGCGFCVPNEVQAANVNAVVGPKDFGSLIGKSIAFGQKRGYVENQKLTVHNQIPTWQFATLNNGSITLLANQPWGKNRVSDAVERVNLVNPDATVQQYFYREGLKYLNDDVNTFFTEEQLNLLQKQISVEKWDKMWENGETKYSGVFALPTEGQLKALGEDKRKRGSPYWAAWSVFRIHTIAESGRVSRKLFYYLNYVVETNGRYGTRDGRDENYIYPTMAFNKPLAFIHYGDKNLGNTTFSSQKVSEPTITLKNLTFVDTNREKNLNITKLNVATDKIIFTAEGLATGAGQGIGGLVEGADGNYLAYARLADTDNGRAEKVEIKFDDSVTGSNTIHLFNEWLGSEYDLAGNYYEMYVKSENAKITAFNNKWNVTYDELTIGKGVDYTAEGSSNVTAKNKFIWENGNGDKLVNITNVDNGYIHLGGAFSLETPDDAIVTNRTLKLTKTGDVWNNMDLYGINDGVMAMNVDLNSLYMERGTFTIQGNLKAADYLQLRNGAELTIGGDLQAKRLEVNGVLNLANGAVTGETHLCNDSTLNLTNSNKTLNLGKSLTADAGAKISGVDNSDKVVISENLTAKGNLTLDKITLEVRKDIQVQGNLNSTGVISADRIDVKGNLTANNITVDNMQAGGDICIDTLEVKNCLNVANGKKQGGTIEKLVFGESGKPAAYVFDMGTDVFAVTNSGLSEVKLVPKYSDNLSGATIKSVFVTSGGDLSGLKMSDARVTDMANKKTYLLTQDTVNKGDVNIRATKHNVAVNLADAVKGQKIFWGNYWQENRNVKQPVLWSCVKQDNGQPIFLSDKILANTGNIWPSEISYKIADFLKKNSVFGKDLFTAGELATLNVTNGDVLGLPFFDDVRDGGNYGWNADNRKVQATPYAGDWGRYYALGSMHYYGANGFHVWVNDYIDSQNGVVENYNEVCSTYGIRPTISFDNASVLFATNAESGKGSVAERQLTRLKDVDENSTLELTFDDAYLAAKAGTERQTGDIRTDVNIVLQGSNLSLKYSNAKYMDENSYVSCLIGESNLAEDYFGYGKADRVNKLGSDTLSINMANFPSEQGDNGYAMTLFNEYGNGTSFVGGMQVLPGSFRVDKGNLVYSIAPGDIQGNIQVGAGNILELTGSGALEKKISGAGKVLVMNNGITASGDLMAANFETAEGVTMAINDGKVTGSLKGNYDIQISTVFAGRNLEGNIKGHEFILASDAKVTDDLYIEHFNGTGGYVTKSFTLDMRQSGGDTPSYNTLTIGKLQGWGKLALDADLVNLQSDKIILNGVAFEGNTITLAAVNITAAPETFEGVYTISNAATGDKKDAVVTKEGGLKVFTPKGKYTVTIENGNLKFDTGIAPAPNLLGAPATTIFGEFIEAAQDASYSFMEDEILPDAVITGSEDPDVKTEKDVFLNGYNLTGNGNEGITVEVGHILSITGNGEISGFGTALKVENTGVLNLADVIFTDNTTDVYNQGDMNIEGTVTMETLKGVGTTTIARDGELNLGGATAQEITQKFAGEGTLNFTGDISIQVDKLGTAMNTVAAGKTLTLTSGTVDYKTLIVPVSGEGRIKIAGGTEILTNANNLQVAVENNGKLTIGVDETGRIAKDITGTGELEFAQHTIVEGGDIQQNKVTVNKDVAVEIGQLTATEGITNKGSLLINAGDLHSNVTNEGNGSFEVNNYTMENGAVYLYSMGTETSQTLTKEITNGKVFVMDDVQAVLANFNNTEIYINGDANLTLNNEGTAEETINADIKGCKVFDGSAGTGTLITNGNFAADLAKVQVPVDNWGELALSGTGTNDSSVINRGVLTVATGTSIPKVDFAGGSTLIMEANEATAPLTVMETIVVDPAAKLFVQGAEKGGTYKVVTGDAVAADFAGWELSNIRGEDANGRKVKGEESRTEENIYSVTFKSAIPQNTDIGNILENAEGKLADWAEKLSEHYDALYGEAGDAYTANAINSMASASVLAGVQKGAANMVVQITGNIAANVGVGTRPILSGGRGQGSGIRNISASLREGKRAAGGEGVVPTTVETGRASDVMPSAYKEKAYDKQVWASYIHSKQNIDGLESGSLQQDSTIQMNGLTVGADLWSNGKGFGGIALSYADGNTHSNQISTSTRNDADYYGISVYHRQDMGQYALTMDLGYTYNKNDITQSNTAKAEEVTSKPKSHAYTLGMKLEREFRLSKASKLVPFAGVRYTCLQNKNFTNSLGATTEVDNQNLVTLVRGISFHSHLVTTEGWKLGSILEAGYEWNFGNRHSTQRFGYGGAYSTIGFDVTDRGQYFLKAALTASHNNMFFELGYRYSKGSSVRDNRWNINVNFSF